MTVRRTHGVQLASTVLLKAHHVNAHRSFIGLEGAFGSDERGPLKAAGVGTVDHGFSHGLNQGNRFGLKEGGHREGDVKRVLVQSERGLFVQLDEPRIGRLCVHEGSVALGLKTSSDVNSATFTAAGAETPLKPRPLLGKRVDGDVVQFTALPRVKFSGGQLLMDLNAAHEAKLLRVQSRSAMNIALRFIGHGSPRRSPFMSTTLD